MESPSNIYSFAMLSLNDPCKVALSLKQKEISPAGTGAPLESIVTVPSLFTVKVTFPTVFEDPS
jgi:hypothetical protein